MVVNFRARGISRSAHKLIRTLTLIIKKKIGLVYYIYCFVLLNYLQNKFHIMNRGRQFESHKFQTHWRLTWSLTSGPVGLVDMYVSWHDHSH